MKSFGLAPPKPSSFDQHLRSIRLPAFYVFISERSKARWFAVDARLYPRGNWVSNSLPRRSSFHSATFTWFSLLNDRIFPCWDSCIFIDLDYFLYFFSNIHGTLRLLDLPSLEQPLRCANAPSDLRFSNYASRNWNKSMFFIPKFSSQRVNIP